MGERTTLAKYLAVYGILRSDLYDGDLSPSSRFLEPFADSLGSCKIPGVLYDCGMAALLPGNGEVVGELWEVRQPVDKNLLARVDCLESAYERRTVRLVEPDVDADAYFFRYLRAEDLRVPSGDWADRARWWSASSTK